MPRPLLYARILLGQVIIVLALFVPYLPRIVARIRGTEASRGRLTFGEAD